MRRVPSFREVLSAVLLVWGALLPGGASAEVLVSGPPVAPLPASQGSGLCAASSVSTNPANDFPQSASTYVASLNAFLEARAHTRVTSVIRTPLDLSNNVNDGRTLSYGDFVNAVPGCPTAGCGFAFNDTTTSFATRLRGFLAVSSEQVGQSLHLGFYADDSVGLTLFDGDQRAYPVIVRPPQIGFPTWRATQTVQFERPGLYGIEVLFTQISEHAALELSLLEGTFTDFERPANSPPIVVLSNVGFTLLRPEAFQQTVTGRPSFEDLTRCAQCNRQYADAPGNGDCDRGYHCNAAALCAPCDTNLHCGDACMPCGASTPFCASPSGTPTCVQCREASDCLAPDACHAAACDAQGTCTYPNVADGTECPGGTCQQGTCTPPDAGSPDAGAEDAGTGPDAGGPDVDGGTEPGGPDGSVVLDAGSPDVDAGTEPGGPDGSVGLDAGGPDGGGAGADSGTGPGEADGSVPDTDGGSTGGTPDAGTGTDAGTQPGGGDGSEDSESGCGCGGGSSALAPLCLAALALLLGRSRRPPRHR